MQRILFVCTGNTCRSPMAEAILKNKQIDRVEVRSAGIYAANGSEASTHAKKVLEDNGIAHNHRSSLLTRAEVEWADLILTMTFSHKMAILQQYPQMGQKVFTLKEYSDEGSGSDVVDPYGGSLAMYEETFRELNGLIDKAIGKLK
ncbi:low molecular weight protein arginine phosphatase [Neobacillus drentensis]|uniref:low molecular weight protein arginine phosphatase n=1 Tax=Neobacillus drentensis TaxID=220684 RepID=UPI00286531DA|nr:low molecular weight protein arginine phosphatase [Neobacillus drentensis]MDR7239344.1 protein-tyrosine phosphatase [Neobacillus drentensis]